MALRPCLGRPGKPCGRLTDGPGSRCPACQQVRERARGSATRRGYDVEHQRTRVRLLPLAYGRPCPRCGELMVRGQALDLGHTVPLMVDRNSRADRIEHAACNRGARDSIS